MQTIKIVLTNVAYSEVLSTLRGMALLDCPLIGAEYRGMSPMKILQYIVKNSVK